MTKRDEAAPRPDAEPGSERSQPSRRAMLRGAAGAGIAATAVAATGGTALAAVIRPNGSQASAAAASGGVAADHDGEAIVAHLLNARTGEIDVFHGTEQVRVHDRDLAARIIRASH